MAVSGIMKSAVYSSERLTTGIQQYGSQTVWQHESISLVKDIKIVCHEMMITQFILLFDRDTIVAHFFLAIIESSPKQKKPLL
jgi:hypothetical protein